MTPTTKEGKALLERTGLAYSLIQNWLNSGRTLSRPIADWVPTEQEVAAIEAEARAEGAAAEGVEALRHLFFILERLDRQATDPSPDHFVKITVETWRELVRPAIQQVRAILAVSTDRGEA